METASFYPDLSLAESALYDVTGLGVSAVDIVSLVDHLPSEGEVLQASEMTISSGGPVSTAIVTLARLGACTAMIDALGDDWRAHLVLSEYTRAGVDTRSIRVLMGRQSSTATILVHQKTDERSIVFFPGDLPELTGSDLPGELIKSSKILHLNGRHWPACLEAVRFARQFGVRISFDGGAYRFRNELKELVPMVDICIVAENFAQRYTGVDHLDQAAKILLSEGPSLVVITSGIRGSYVFTRNGESFHQPAYLMTSTKDTTGCGDSFHGAFLFGLVNHMDLRKTAMVASAVAALNSLQLGGRKGLPDLNQVDQFLESQFKIQNQQK
jgi:sulfofructose kinase